MSRKTLMIVGAVIAVMAVAIDSMQESWQTLQRDRIGFDVVAGAAAKKKSTSNRRDRRYPPKHHRQSQRKRKTIILRHRSLTR